jgi:chemotaxis protein MotA
MDLATVLGLLLAWGALMISLIMEGGDPRALVNIPAFLLVFGGTLGAATVSFRLNQIMGIPDILRKAFTSKEIDVRATIAMLVQMAERARRDGLLTLEADAEKAGDEFLERGIRLAVDGTDPEMIREILSTEIHFLQSRHKVGESIFTTMGGFAPTLGIIGTVMGLIHMLTNLSDPGKMGPLIAGAFIATLYGVSSANLVFLPIGNKLKARSAEEVLVREIIIEGILAVQAGDNPRIVEDKLMAFVAPRLRNTQPLSRGAIQRYG